MNSLLIIDGFYFLYRNFYGMPSRYNSNGMNVNALEGFSYSIQKAKREYSYTHTVVVLDSSEPTFRHKLCPGYKSDRVVPHELKPQIPYIEPLLKAMDVPYIKKPGYEGDDLIGTIAKRFLKKEEIITILSGDKDMTQLVNNNITVEEIFNRKYYNREGVFNRFGVYPEQMIDYLTLVGDAADSIKGVPGIGSKTAVSLLKEYKTLDNLIANVDKLKDKFSNAIKDNLESIKKDKLLATIVTDIEMEIDFDSIKSKDIKADDIIEFKKNLFY